jgi:hypothetical protein
MAQESPGNRLRRLPYLYAAGAVFWLVLLTQFVAFLAAPLGRQQLEHTLANAGFAANAGPLLAVESALIVFFELSAAALHAAAFYGLRRYRAWGWAAAVIAAGAWSLLLVGIPVFVFLLRRQTRAAYGVP